MDHRADYPIEGRVTARVVASPAMFQYDDDGHTRVSNEPFLTRLVPCTLAI